MLSPSVSDELNFQLHLLNRRLEKKESAFFEGMRGPQVEGLDGINGKLQQGRFHTYVDMPGGSGKTRLAIKLLELMTSGHTPPRTVFVTPTKLLLKQTLEAFETVRPDWVTERQSIVGAFYGESKKPGQRITITTPNSFIDGVRAGLFRPEATDVLAIDERHLMLSDLRQGAIDLFGNSVQLGLTASPAYSSERTVAEHMDLAYKLSIEDAVRRRVIAPFRNLFLMSENSTLDRVALKSSGEYDERQLEAATDVMDRYKVAIDFYRNWVDPHTQQRMFGKQVIAFASSIAQAEKIAAFFNAYFQSELPRGIQMAAPIHGEMTKKQREDIDRRYRAGRILMLTSADYLIHGYDNPRASICLNFRPSRSAVSVTQRGARVVRIDPDDPLKWGYIVDIIDRSEIGQIPLLYAEVVGGTVFGTQASELVTHKQDLVRNALKEYWKQHKTLVSGASLPTEGQSSAVATPAAGGTEQSAGNVVTNIDELIAVTEEGERIAQPKLGVIREGVVRNKIVPEIYSLMKAAGYQTVRSMHANIMAKNPEDPYLDYKIMYFIACGRESPWDQEGNARPEALALARELRFNIVKVFGPQEEFREKAKTHYVIGSILPAIREAMHANGITSVTDFYRLVALTTNIQRSTFNAYITGRRSPFYRETGPFLSHDETGSLVYEEKAKINIRYTSTANEIATVLNMLPEDLWGTNPLAEAAASFDLGNQRVISPIVDGIHQGNVAAATTPLEIMHQSQARAFFANVAGSLTSSPAKQAILNHRLALDDARALDNKGKYDPRTMGADGRSNVTLGQLGTDINVSGPRAQQIAKSMQERLRRGSVARVAEHLLTPLDQDVVLTRDDTRKFQEVASVQRKLVA